MLPKNEVIKIDDIYQLNKFLKECNYLKRLLKPKKQISVISKYSEKIVELNWNEVFKIDEVEFTSLPARHFSGRGPLNRNSTLWSSWAIKSSAIKISKVVDAIRSKYGLQSIQYANILRSQKINQCLSI